MSENNSQQPRKNSKPQNKSNNKSRSHTPVKGATIDELRTQNIEVLVF